MSRHVISNSKGETVAYGFDRMGHSPGLFINDQNGLSWDTRGFLADPGCKLTKGSFVEKMEELKALGFNDVLLDQHIKCAALDLPF